MSRRLVLAILVPLLLLVGADQGVRLVAQASLAGRLQGELGLAERPAVRLGGFPFLLHLARQRFPVARLEADGAVLHGFRFARLDVELRRVRFSFETGEVSSSGGRGELVIDEAGATEYLRSQHHPNAEVRFLGPDVAIGILIEFGGPGKPIRSIGRLKLRKRTLLFVPRRTTEGGVEIPSDSATIELPLPDLRPLRTQGLRVQRGRVVIGLDWPEGVVALR